MKKFGLIAGLATLVTVGGVFAAWTFGDITSIADDEHTVSIVVDEEVHDNAELKNVDIVGSLALSFAQSTSKTSYLATGDAANKLQLQYTNNSGRNMNATVTWTVEIEDTTGKLGDYVKLSELDSALEGSLTIALPNSAEATTVSADITRIDSATIAAAFNAQEKNTIISAAEASTFIAAIKATTITYTIDVTFA